MVARTPGGREVASSILVAPTMDRIEKICYDNKLVGCSVSFLNVALWLLRSVEAVDTI